MSDIIQQTHALFREHFGANMRQWPQGAQELLQACTGHVSKTHFKALERGQKEGREEVLARLKEFLDTEAV